MKDTYTQAEFDALTPDDQEDAENLATSTNMNATPTYSEIANDWGLWNESINASAAMSFREWVTTPAAGLIEIIVACNGPETWDD